MSKKILTINWLMPTHIPRDWVGLNHEWEKDQTKTYFVFWPLNRLYKQCNNILPNPSIDFSHRDLVKETELEHAHGYQPSACRTVYYEAPLIHICIGQT